MSHAEKCPVCGGTGEVFKETGTSAGKAATACHGCGGRGWVEVQDGAQYYSVPYYYPCYPPREFPPYRITLGGETTWSGDQPANQET
jgi:hypothetical protein